MSVRPILKSDMGNPTNDAHSRMGEGGGEAQGDDVLL